MSRNRTVSSSAIARAVQDASCNEYGSAIETLVTAISLIKQSKVASDDRCKILISSLQDTLHGIENKSYGASRRERSRSRERGYRSGGHRHYSRERDYRERDYYRERSRSRERDYRREDKYYDDRDRYKDRERIRDIDRDRMRDPERDRERIESSRMREDMGRDRGDAQRDKERDRERERSRH